jgi:hypothetical protein
VLFLYNFNSGIYFASGGQGTLFKKTLNMPLDPAKFYEGKRGSNIRDRQSDYIVRVRRHYVAKIRIAVTPGFRKDERVEEILALGIKDFIEKPYTFK